MKPSSHPFLRQGAFRTPMGWCAAAWTPRGLSALTFPQATKNSAFRKLATYLPPNPAPPSEAKVPADFARETLKVLAGKRHRVPKLDLWFLTQFQRKILRATSRIPVGETRTYAWTSRRAGSPRGCRAAGQALNRNPVPLLVPCHRVVESSGKLGGFGGGIPLKRRLLHKELAQYPHRK